MGKKSPASKAVGEYGKGLPHKKPIASETDARKMQSFARLGGLKEATASIGGEYFTAVMTGCTGYDPVQSGK